MTSEESSWLLFFASLEWARFISSHELSSLVNAIQKLVVITLVVIRSEAAFIDRHLYSWVLVVLSTFGMSFFQAPLRGEDTVFWIADVVRLAVFVWMIVSLGFLGKNFGMLPAYRGVSEGGPYGWIRHPYYLGAILVYICELLLRFSVRSLVFFMVAEIAIFWRLQREEALLLQHEEYREYCKRVQYRLLYRVY